MRDRAMAGVGEAPAARAFFPRLSCLRSVAFGIEFLFAVLCAVPYSLAWEKWTNYKGRGDTITVTYRSNEVGAKPPILRCGQPAAYGRLMGLFFCL